MDDEIFSAAVLSKLPLADATWRILHFTLADSWLQDLWNRERGRCYEKVLEFSTLARLVAEALTQHGGSGRQAFERGQESDTLPVAISSAFDKLGNLPLPLSEKLLEEGTQRLVEILPAGSAVDPFPLPGCWEGHEVFGVDGKAIKHVKRLLKPLRGLQAGILGARSSVALNLRTGMAVGMIGDLDGEAGEGALTERLLSNMVAAAGGKPWVAVLDRLYCNLSFPHLVLAAGGHFLIRYCSNTHFVADPARPAQESRDARGQRIVQEWGRLGKSAGPRALYVRRITLHLAGGTVISVITDLLDETAYPAEDLLATYRKRWGIERVFHQITDVFSLKNLIGSPPRAVLFQ
ncbi:MAG TPA: transposase, partial [Isosphaeraceae bacterium]|nr:transposase [Isosphaeraceae bacterium]